MVTYAILTSLTTNVKEGQPPEELLLLSSEVQWMQLTGGGNSAQMKLVKLLNVRPTSFQEIWRTPQGREWAGRIAFRDLSLAEFYRVPACLLGMALIQSDAFERELSDEEHAMIWKAVQDAHGAYLAGLVTESHLLALGSEFKGISITGFNWDYVAKSLDPAVRGPIAYVFGHRYLRLKNSNRAAAFFQAAIADAPPESALRRLAHAALEKHTKKNDNTR